MVRSNEGGAVGFLADARRMNVAVTRARCQVCLVCDSATVGANPFLRRLLQHVRTQGAVVGVRELLAEGSMHAEARALGAAAPPAEAGR